MQDKAPGGKYHVYPVAAGKTPTLAESAKRETTQTKVVFSAWWAFERNQMLSAVRRLELVSA